MSEDPYYNDPPEDKEPGMRDFAKWLLAPVGVAILLMWLFF